ncbi:cytochrome P450 76T24-like [Salvia miltiorrhiza]|uniref:cytochrome P450 76T24-like n=1 Tax=Salvia miltiorrhiza TaxID=226208 RepID=UPI0025AD1E5F|nr:cytochrome P450 76T24-like [Salvia miltiorrhiza]
MDSLTSSLLAISIVWICILILTSHSRARRASKVPPGPYGPPIIGNILQLGSKPHRSLAKLSQKYGPVMSLKLGSFTTVVFSTPEAAKVVLQQHDASFSSRAIPTAATAHRHHEFSMGWLPVGAKWRKLRRVYKEQMFSAARLDASEGLRREKLRKLREYVGECGGAGRAVDVGEAAFATTLNLMSAWLFSVEFARLGSESSHEMKDVVWGVMECLGSPNLADYFPVLRCVDPQRILKKTEFYVGKLLAIFEEIIDEKLKSSGERDDLVGDFIDLYQRDEAQLSRNDITHLLLDLFVAGTDTTAGTVEWAMAELMHNPSKMSRLRNEIRNFMQENGEIEESDITRLPYLKAVVKETFRLHPAAPFLIPRKADFDVQINGYLVPKEARILVNVWASGRDPNIWANPDEFVPERFLNENDSLDFRGQDFELIPFGAGRRICPGLPLANLMVHQMLVTCVGNFEWKFETVKQEEMDMNEKIGITLRKALPLKAIPIELD